MSALIMGEKAAQPIAGKCTQLPYITNDRKKLAGEKVARASSSNDYWPFEKVVKHRERSKSSDCKRAQSKQNQIEFANQLCKQVEAKQTTRKAREQSNRYQTFKYVQTDYWKPQPVHRHNHLLQQTKEIKVDPITWGVHAAYPIPAPRKARTSEFDFNKWGASAANSLPIGFTPSPFEDGKRFPRKNTDVISPLRSVSGNLREPFVCALA